MPTLFIAHEDLTNDEPGSPGLGKITCTELNAASGARALKAALQLGKWIVEHGLAE